MLLKGLKEKVNRMQALCRRKYRTISLLILVALLFYLLQCLSVSRLGQISHNQARAWGFTSGHSNDDDDHMLLKGRKRVVDGESRMHEGIVDMHLVNDEDNLDKLDREDKVGSNLVKNTQALDSKRSDLSFGSENQQNDGRKKIGSKDKTNMKIDTDVKGKNRVGGDGKVKVDTRGVHNKDRHLYTVRVDGLFACFKDPKHQIEPDQVNDDFCDCADGSDEPGTSACPNGSFYCGQQIHGLPPQFVSSSKVNDGICDCCDGSDEWAGALVPEDIRIQEGAKHLGAVFHAPCSNKCGAIVQEKAKEEKIREHGRQIQQDYIKQAHSDLSASSLKIYGPEGVFYPLSKKCFTLEEKTQYTYKVCPFSKVEQQKGGTVPTVLGRNFKPMELDKGEHLLVMDGGDSKLCPFGRSRVAKIRLICGLEEAVLKVSEPELCEYLFTLSTPAAC